MLCYYVHTVIYIGLEIIMRILLRLGFLSALFLVLALNVNPILANDNVFDEKLSLIGFDKLFALDDHSEISRVVNNQAKYASEHKLEKIKELYADDYFNSDGFNRDLFFKMVEETWDAYPNISYTVQIKNITIDNDFALVEVFETAMGETKTVSEILDEKGLLYSESTTVYCLKKQGRSWKIFSDYIISEKDSLRFGDTKNLTMDISAPAIISAKKDYTASLSINLPKDSIILASLNNDPIVYPNIESTAIFKNLKTGGVLERVLTSNSDNHNEFAIASIGVTKAKINKEKNIDLTLSGIAFLRSRVNVIPQRNVNAK